MDPLVWSRGPGIVEAGCTEYRENRVWLESGVVILEISHNNKLKESAKAPNDNVDVQGVLYSER
jgi:hypothetical protein